jgi:hypothetical protein
MKFIAQIILALYLSCACGHLKAQNDTVPPLATLLPTLSAEQQRKVLDYAHFLGAYYGKGLEATCNLLDTKNQERVAQYIAVLKNPGKLDADHGALGPRHAAIRANRGGYHPARFIYGVQYRNRALHHPGGEK